MITDAKLTCGDCAHYEEWNPPEPRQIRCRAMMAIKLPVWGISSMRCVPTIPRATNAQDCECFERKDAK